MTDRIQFSSHEWKLLNEQYPGPPNLPDGEWFDCIAAIPDLLQRSKAALRLFQPPSLHLLKLEFETGSLLTECKRLIIVLRERLQNYDPLSISASLRDHIHAHYLRSVGLALGTGIILNCILSGLEGRVETKNEESSLWSEEIVSLSQIAKKYRPLGAMAMLICLRMAWLGAADPDAREEVEALLHDYDTVCLGGVPSDQCSDLVQGLRRFTLQDI